MAQEFAEERTFYLGSTQTIETCRQLADQLRDRLSAPGALVIDAAGFEEGDLTVVQVLLAARKSATASGCRLEITNPSPDFSALLRQAGVATV